MSKPNAITSDIWFKRVFGEQSDSLCQQQLSILPSECDVSNKQLDAKLNEILDYHRVLTGAPGLTCAVYVNPYCWNNSIQDDKENLQLTSFDNDALDSIFDQAILSPLSQPFYHRGKVVFCGASGVNNIDTMSPMTPQNTMMVASITKLITSILFGRLSTFPLQDTLLQKYKGIASQNTTISPIITLDTTLWDLLSFGDFFGWKVLISNHIKLHKQGNYPFDASDDHTYEHVDGFNPISFPKQWMSIARADYQASLPTEEATESSSSLSSITTTTGHTATSELDDKVIPEKFIIQASITHLLQFKEQYTSITMEGLLSHTAGIRNYNFPRGEHHCNTNHPTSLSAALEFMFDPLLDNYTTEIDTIDNKKKHLFSYSTFGFTLVQIALELSIIRMYYNIYILLYPNGIISLHNLQQIFPFDCVAPSFSYLVQTYITTPLGLQNLSHEFWRVAYSSQRAIEYSHAPHTPQQRSTESNNPYRMPSNQLLRPIITNKSNVGGCIIADARSLALFGGSLTRYSIISQYNIINQYNILNKNDFLCQSYLYKISTLHLKFSPQITTHSEKIESKSYNDTITGHSASISSLHSVASAGYGLGCFNLHLTTLASNSSSFNRIHTHLNKNSLQTIVSQYPLPASILRSPTIFHTGRSVGSSGQLVIALRDGIAVSILANVGLIDVKACGLDIACAVKQFLIKKTHGQ